MDIIYSTQAKEELAKIDWRIREKIINILRDMPVISFKRRGVIKPIHNSDLHKIEVQGYLVIGKFENKKLNVVSVLKKRTIKLPE